MDENAHRPAGPHDHCRTDVETSLDEPIACSLAALLRRFAHRANQLAFAIAGAKLGSDAEKRRKRDTLDQLPAMRIDAVANAGIA